MRRLLVVNGLIAVIGLLEPSQAGARQTATAPREPDVPLVVTHGEGLVRAAPDRAFVTITVEARARSPKDAQRQSAGAMTAVQQKVQAAGIPKEAIRTVAYDLQQEFDFVEGKRISRGFVARNSVEVRVDRIDQAGELVDAAVGAGATSVGSIQFDLKDREKLEREALRLAVADARARADAAATGAGRTIDRVVRIEESRLGELPPPRPMMAMRAEVTPETPISPGELEIRAQVTLTATLR